MKCLKCGREFSSKKEVCIYCGASLDGQASLQSNYIVNEVSNIFISDDQNTEVNLKDLPETVRYQVEDAIRKGNDKVIVKEESTIVQLPLASADEEPKALSFENVLIMLSKMGNSLNDGHLEHSVYEKIVTDILKDYISTLADNIKLDFVVNRITDSEVSDYLNEKILKDLRAFVISSISEKNKL